MLIDEIRAFINGGGLVCLRRRNGALTSTVARSKLKS